jgi:hypothetical protein
VKSLLLAIRAVGPRDVVAVANHNRRVADDIVAAAAGKVVHRAAREATPRANTGGERSGIAASSLACTATVGAVAARW